MTPPVARCWGCFKNMASALTGWWDAHRPTTVKRSHFEGTHARANTKVFNWMSVVLHLELDPSLNGTSSKFETPLLVVVSDYGKGSWMNLWCGRAKAAEVLVDPVGNVGRHAGGG